jgi:hypothetical protein
MQPFWLCNFGLLRWGGKKRTIEVLDETFVSLFLTALSQSLHPPGTSDSCIVQKHDKRDTLYFNKYTFVIWMTFLLLQGSALGTMVGQLSYGKRQFESVDGTVRQLIVVLHTAMNDFLPLTDADTDAFNQYMVLTDTTWLQKHILFYDSL